jgi:hypothetical protein
VVIETNCPVCLYYPVYYQESGEQHIYKDCQRCGDFVLTVCAKKYTSDIDDREECSRQIRISKNKNFTANDFQKYSANQITCCSA